jgi:hypothetical protein
MNAEQKKKAVMLFQLYKSLIVTNQILDSDVKFASEQWRKDKSSQFWGRTLVRCCCASVEGTLSVLKNTASGNAKYFDIKLDEGDIEVVTGLRTDKKSGLTKPAFLPFRKNVKETFKVFIKSHGIQFEIKYDDLKFTDLCDTFELRNKLMHPKEQRDLEVSDKALDAADRGLKWFGYSLRDVLDECSKKQPFSKNTLNK